MAIRIMAGRKAMDQTKIGRFIAECRKEKQLTQQELAERLGLTDKAEENLQAVLENSAFTLQDRIRFFKKKWCKDHISVFVMAGIAWLAAILLIKLKWSGADMYVIGYVGGLLALLLYGVIRNRMMVYVEQNAFRK